MQFLTCSISYTNITTYYNTKHTTLSVQTYHTVSTKNTTLSVQKLPHCRYKNTTVSTKNTTLSVQSIPHCRYTNTTLSVQNIPHCQYKTYHTVGIKTYHTVSTKHTTLSVQKIPHCCNNYNIKQYWSMITSQTLLTLVYFFLFKF